jgi:hypothetical protein
VKEVRQYEFHSERARTEQSRLAREFHRRQADKIESQLIAKFRTGKMEHKLPKALAEKQYEFLAFRRDGNLALADNDCVHCHGLGLKTSRKGKSCTCRCVFRAVCRIVVAKSMTIDQTSIGRVSIYHTSRGPLAEMREQDYRADLYKLACRHLTDLEALALHAGMILHLGWADGCRWVEEEWNDQLAVGATDQPLPDLHRGLWFHSLYRAQEKMGQLALDHGLYPLEDYFGGARCSFRNQGNPSSSWKHPWLNGGAWEEFSEDPKFAAQYKAQWRKTQWRKNNFHLEYRQDDWRRFPTKPMVPAIVDQPEVVEQTADPASSPKVKRRSYRVLFVGKDRNELKVEGGAKGYEAMTNEYCRSLGMVTKYYQWVDGESTATLMSLGKTGRLLQAKAHAIDVGGEVRLYSLFGEKPRLIGRELDMEQAKETIAKMVTERANGR